MVEALHACALTEVFHQVESKPRGTPLVLALTGVA
jgi:hypothetical protein